MTNILELFLLACGLGFLFFVLSLLLKRRISEWNSISWLTAAIVILIVAANPELVDWCAELLGISYPPSLLFLFSTLVLLLLVLYQSMQISMLQNKLRQLAQHVAIQQRLEHDAEEGR